MTFCTCCSTSSHSSVKQGKNNSIKCNKSQSNNKITLGKMVYFIYKNMCAHLLNVLTLHKLCQKWDCLWQKNHVVLPQLVCQLQQHDKCRETHLNKKANINIYLLFCIYNIFIYAKRNQSTY